MKYNNHTDFAGGSLTQAISSGLNINIRRAEELKKQRGLLGAGGEFELSTLIFPFLDAIINESNKARIVFEKNQGGRIERVLLAGGGANLWALKNILKSKLIYR